ncbi:toll-like receptor 3 [Strongylocentrotus purpuratus]|uniref:TIR domain-containing protein n=1 Tax=Strongylocentrotus purpuratus TaxID=7668 RepID=A0A7M7P876_STRPU|nr:toll-like receptor 3 [Strongylocentrotus purpuratus]
MAVYAHAISFVVLCGFTLQYGVVMDHTNITLNHTCSENSSDHSTNCSYRGLTSVPRNLSHDLRSLNVSNNNISMLLDKSLVNYTQLETLYASYNSIYLIENEAFHALLLLKVLMLNHNNISALPISLLEKNCHLSSLILNHNRLKRIPRIFGNNLQTTKFAEDGEDACGCKNLSRFDLSSNKVRSLVQEDFVALQNCSFKRFNLNYNDIKNISRAVFTDLSAVHLLINYITLAEFHAESFLGNKAILKATITRSGITSIVPMNTSEIPRHLFPGLTKLYLRSNKLITIPKYALDGFENLQVLDIGNNQLSSFHNESFCGLKSLVNLRLAANKIKTLQRGSFACAEKLENIDLSRNDLSVLDPQCRLEINSCGQFSHTSALRTLNLSRTKIKAEDLVQRKSNRSLFSGLVSLRTLRLPHNFFEDFHHVPNAFTKLWNLHELDLADCRIHKIDSGIFRNLTSLTYLSLALNYIRIVPEKLAIIGYEEIIENKGPEDYEYQLNLMFREDDEWWINDCMKPFLQERMPHLEHIVFGDNGLHPGSFYLNAIYDVIENSYKTVLLLSNQSVEDTWFMTKLRMAVEHMNDTKLEKIILIFLEDIGDDHLPYLVRLLLSRNKPYLLWVDDDEDGQEFFWAKFEKSMRANREMNNVIPV